MRSQIILCFTIIFALRSAANNIQISNISLTGQNTTNKTVQVQFTVSWDNSWRVSAGPGNWDASWVFIKFRKGSNGAWTHASLVNTGQITPSGSIVTPGLVDPALAFNIATNPAVGAFVHQSANGSGSFSAPNTQLRWNYGQDGLADVDLVDIQVFAIEMVYVPQGAFAAGDGGVGNGQFTLTTINTSNPLLGPSGTGSLGGQGGGYPTGQLAPSTATWPNGYNAFYQMKYEVSQQGYVDFLNTLSRTQQSNRVATVITTGTVLVSARFVMSGSSGIISRSGIACNIDISATAPVIFYCDLNNNQIGGEPSDGKELACSRINWADLAAYLAWAGLRPMTELEYEKSGRGNNLPLLNEFAWGNKSMTSAKAIIDLGLPSEKTNPDANCNFGGFQSGPVRNGAFASASTGREQSGAGFYGAMELTGNLWERCVTLAVANGRNFAGSHGNGKLDANANPATNGDWPPATALGAPVRGGSYQSLSTSGELEFSGRPFVTGSDGGRLGPFGGRGARTAQ